MIVWVTSFPRSGNSLAKTILSSVFLLHGTSRYRAKDLNELVRRRDAPQNRESNPVALSWSFDFLGPWKEFRAAAHRPPKPADGMLRWSVEPSVSQRLNALGARHNATRLMVRLAAFSALLAAESGRSEVIIGLYVSMRRLPAFANCLGPFINLAPLRVIHQPARSYSESIAAIRDKITALDAHSDLPFRDMRFGLRRQWMRQPKIDAIFQQTPMPQTLSFSGLAWRPLGLREPQFTWGLTVSTDEHGKDQGNHCFFDVRIYDPARVRAFLDRYARLLDFASRDPDKPLGDLLAMSEPALAAAQ